MVISSVPAAPPKGDGVNDAAYFEAHRVFNKCRTSVAMCLRVAISAYRRAEMHENMKTCGHLQIGSAETEQGLALIVNGFKDEADIESFMEKFLAPRE